MVEEYDDGKGDRPSCYQGVKRRLFQSVLGHPISKIITMDDIKQELREYVRDAVRQQLETMPDSQLDLIRQAWTTLCDGEPLNETQQVCLTAFNIPANKQAGFIQYLNEKYPAQFNESPEFKREIDKSFKITKAIQRHLDRFAGEIAFTALLTARKSERTQSTNQAIQKAQIRLLSCEAMGQAISKEMDDLISNNTDGAIPGSDGKLIAIAAAINALPTEALSAGGLTSILNDPAHPLSLLLNQPVSVAMDSEFQKKLNPS